MRLLRAGRGAHGLLGRQNRLQGATVRTAGEIPPGFRRYISSSGDAMSRREELRKVLQAELRAVDFQSLYTVVRGVSTGAALLPSRRLIEAISVRVALQQRPVGG